MRVNGWMENTAYPIFIYAICWKKVQKCTVSVAVQCVQLQDAYCFVLSTLHVLTDFISAIYHSQQQFTDSCLPLKHLVTYFFILIISTAAHCIFYYSVQWPTNAQLFHKLSHSSYMFWHYCIILREFIVSTLPSYNSMSLQLFVIQFKISHVLCCWNLNV
jgi:hypothetical protein